MIQRVRYFLKLSFLAPALAALLCLAPVLGAGSACAQPQPGDPGYQYPDLTEYDFLLYLDFVPFAETGQDPSVFCQEHAVKEEHVRAVIFKISINSLDKISSSMDDLSAKYGKSIVFNPSEESFYAKYEIQILDSLARLGASD